MSLVGDGTYNLFPLQAMEKKIYLNEQQGVSVFSQQIVNVDTNT